MKFSFTVYMEPVPKARARISIKNGKAWAYTPSKTLKAELTIRDAFMKIADGEFFERNIPVKLTVSFFRAKPASTSKKVLLPITAPDIDNYIKTILDSLRNYAFVSDAQVTNIQAVKRFGFPPRVEIEIIEDEQ